MADEELIANGREHPEYKERLAVYAWQIYTLSRYVYLGKDGNYKKLSAQRYARELFLDDAETPDELYGRCFKNEQREIGFRIYKAICDCLSPMVAHMGGDRFWPDHVAFLVDYIMQKRRQWPATGYGKMLSAVPQKLSESLCWREQRTLSAKKIAM